MFQPIESFRAICVETQKFIRKPLADRKDLPEELFERPIEFNQFRNQLHLMGETGYTINLLISRQDHLRVMLKALRTGADPLGKEFEAKAERDLEAGRQYAEKVLAVLEKVALGNTG